MKYCYIRVSTIEQNPQRQLKAMEHYEIPQENYYIEKISGKNTNRPELQKLLQKVTAGDVIHIHDFSRLSRSTADLLQIVEDLNKKGVTLISNKEQLDTGTPTGKLMLTMIGAINEFERLTLLERQKEGIAIAKENGTYKKKNIDIELFEELKKEVEAGRITITDASKKLNVSRRTWYNLTA